MNYVTISLSLPVEIFRELEQYRVLHMSDNKTGKVMQRSPAIAQILKEYIENNKE